MFFLSNSEIVLSSNVPTKTISKSVFDFMSSKISINCNFSNNNDLLFAFKLTKQYSDGISSVLVKSNLSKKSEACLFLSHNQ